MKYWMPNIPLNEWLNNRVCRSSITIVIMAALQTKLLSRTSTKHTKPFLFMEWEQPHQDGIAERCILDLAESTHTMLLHAAHRWPETIFSNLWPQALKHATNCRNSLSHNNKEKSLISFFSQTTMEPNINHFHPFGCLVYILQAPLQNCNPFPKWNERSRVGIFLCHSPHQASSVPLILSTQTGLVIPQLHCVFNDNFDTV